MDKKLALHGTKELLPKTLKGDKKPVKLTVLFDYEEAEQAHPYGSTVAYERLVEYNNEEFFLDGTQVDFDALEIFVKNFNDEIDLQEEIDKIQEKAVKDAFL